MAKYRKWKKAVEKSMGWDDSDGIGSLQKVKFNIEFLLFCLY